MVFIYITGAPGTGKSTIQKKLENKGFEAYDLDDSRFGGPYEKASNKRVVIAPAEERTDNWFNYHEWRIYRIALEELKLQAKSKDIIICGVAESDDEVLDLFDKVVYLSVSEDELKDRLFSRVGNDYGKNESELDQVLKRKEVLDKRYANSSSSVILVDTSGTPEAVADEITASLNNNRSS